MPRRFLCICTSTCMHHHAQLHVSRSKCGMVMPPIMGILVVSNGHMNPHQRIDDHPPIQVHSPTFYRCTHGCYMVLQYVARTPPRGMIRRKTWAPWLPKPWCVIPTMECFSWGVRFCTGFSSHIPATFVALLAGTLGPLCHYASDSSPRKSSSSLIRAA